MRWIGLAAAFVLAVTASLASFRGKSASIECDVALLGDSIFVSITPSELPMPLNKACNHAESGATADKIAAKALVLPSRVATVVIEGGINDLMTGRKPGDIAKSYEAAVRDNPRRMFIVVGVLRVDQSMSQRPLPDTDEVEQTNQLLREMCERFENCSVGRYAPLFDPNELTYDGLHPSRRGNFVLAGLLLMDLINVRRQSS